MVEESKQAITEDTLFWLLGPGRVEMNVRLELQKTTTIIYIPLGV